MKINSQIRHAFPPQMKLNRNMLGAVEHDLTKHGGLGLLQVFNKQNEIQIPLVLGQLR